MTNITENKIVYYSASLMIHLALFSAIIIFFDFKNSTTIIGDASPEFVSAYITENNVIKNEVIQTKIIKKTLSLNNKKVEKSSHTIVRKAAPDTSYEESKKSVEVAWLKRSANQDHSKGEHTDALLRLLHTAIQQQQHYPQAAMQMERQGSATVKFTLLKNGSIRNLQLVKSSGTESLDRAALAAVHDAEPFKNTDEYLDTARDFSIEVVFELS